MLADTAQAGALRLFVARIDGRAVAFDIVMAAGDGLFCWVGRFDPAHRAITPGALNQKAIVEHACHR
jgi:CelD/BcsL family acetyltransferase involved in cellulose biosynthesis